MEAEQARNGETKQEERNKKHVKILVATLNCLLMSIGQVGGPLLLRIYYLHGGKRKWLNAWLLTSAFPILILPISLSYLRSRTQNHRHGSSSSLLLTPWLFGSSVLIGILLGLDSYLYSFGLLYLPVSVSSLLGSTQLAFTAIFAFLMVKQKFTHYSINAVVLMSFGSIVLGFHMKGDRPGSGESNGKYLLGFFMTLGGAALHGVIMPGMEYAQRKAGMPMTFHVVLQFQFFVCMFATLLCTVPMIINNDFQAISREAEEFGLGKTKYYLILVMAAISMQLLIIGSIGLVFASSSLMGGLVSALLVPLQQVFAVIFLHEPFNADKGMALAMCLWGFASHLYGRYVDIKIQQG
ncbi:purine permease 3 [Euphorbia peplus]|nr:purine permease 3 [Euphorbia peplus]